MPLENPLTPPERRRAVQLVGQVDQVLADRLEAELHCEDDPLVSALTSALGNSQAAVTARLDDLVREMRATRNWVIGLVALALVLNAGLVGVGVVYRGAGISFATSAQAAEPVEVSGPAPEPTDAPL